MTSTTKPSPRAVLEEALATFAEREARAQESVVTWRTGRAPRASLLPLHDERAHPHARAGKMLKKRAEPRHGIVEYGHDARGRLRVVREHALRGQKGLLHELVLVDHEASAIRWTVHHESPGRSVREVGTIHLEAGSPVRASIVTRHAVIEERYDLDARGRITSIDVHEEREPGTPHAVRTTTRFVIERDARGEVTRVDFDDGRARGATYVRSRASRDEAVEAFVEAVVRATLQALEARPDEADPAFALALTWSSAEPLPPLVQLGAASDRARLGDDRATEPLEWSTSLPVHEDREVVALSAELRAAGLETSEVARALRRAAALLAQRLAATRPELTVLATDWSGRP